MSDIPTTLPGGPPPAAGSAPPPARERWVARLADRLNPILVREVHQALNGKVFVVTAALAFLAVFVIALLIAASDEVSPRAGAEAFLNTLYVLGPILLFIVPLQAFFSMRAEVGGGTVEHLLMSRLRPAQIVRGKLLSTTVQFVLYLAIFAPLLALTYLLRGVDVPTIALVLAMAFILALAGSALAIACGALCRWRALFRVLPFAIVLIGLGWLTFTVLALLTVTLGELRWHVADASMVTAFVSMALSPLVATVLFSLIGASALAHPYENRSTAFRLFALGAVVIAFGWTLYNYEQLDPGLRVHLALGELLAGVVMACGVVLGLFPFFAATEVRTLSPRVRRRVPRSPLLAFVVAPFLPGCGRGLLFALLLAVTVLGGGFVLNDVWGGRDATPLVQQQAMAVWLYVLLFSGLGCAVRGRLGPADTRNWWARSLLPVLMMLSALVPLLVGVAGSSRAMMSRWSPLQLFNPFISLSLMRRDDDILTALAWSTAVSILINVPAMVQGVREVLEASRLRRQRAA